MLKQVVRVVLSLSAPQIAALVNLQTSATSKTVIRHSSLESLASAMFDFGTKEQQRREDVYRSRAASSAVQSETDKVNAARLAMLDSLIAAKNDAERQTILRSAKKIAMNAKTAHKQYAERPTAPRRPRKAKKVSVLSSGSATTVVPPSEVK